MDGVSWAVLRGAVSLLGGDGVSLDLGSEEGRPHRCFSAFEMICLAGCAQSAFLERFGVQEYKCVLFFDGLLLTTAFRQGLSWLPACIHSGVLWAGVTHLGASGQLDLLFRFLEHSMARFQSPFPGRGPPVCCQCLYRQRCRPA